MIRLGKPYGIGGPGITVFAKTNKTVLHEGMVYTSAWVGYTTDWIQYNSAWI